MNHISKINKTEISIYTPYRWDDDDAEGIDRGIVVYIFLQTQWAIGIQMRVFTKIFVTYAKCVPWGIDRHPYFSSRAKVNDTAPIYWILQFFLGKEVQPACLKTGLADVSSADQLLIITVDEGV